MQLTVVKVQLQSVAVNVLNNVRTHPEVRVVIAWKFWGAFPPLQDQLTDHSLPTRVGG